METLPGYPDLVPTSGVREVTATAVAPEGCGSFLEQLRSALVCTAQILAQQGAFAPHLTQMTWTVADLAAIERTHDLADLTFRDVFGGNLPALRIVQSDDLPEHQLVAVSAAAMIPSTAPSREAVYRGFTATEITRLCSPRATIPDSLEIFERWWREGQAARARNAAEGRAQLDVRYGPGRRQLLDLYRPDRSSPPLQIFLHGGYFQAMDKINHAQLAERFVEAGIAVAMVNYDLCPEVSFDTIVEQTREACSFLWSSAEALGYRRGGFQIAGHSAGAVLGALMLSQPWPAEMAAHLFGSAVLVSGLYDLEPLRHTPGNRVLRLDAETAERLTTTHRPPTAGTAPVLVAVGEEESEEFHYQARDLVGAWSQAGHPIEMMVVTGHHFSVVDHFRDRDSALFRRSLELLHAIEPAL